MIDEDLGKWIRDTMTVNEESLIYANKELISRLVSLTKEGKVILSVDKSDLTGSQIVLLHLVGKLFAKVAGYSTNSSATNSEIASEMGIPLGTVGRCLMELRSRGFVRPLGKEEGHGLVLSALPGILNELRGVANG